MASQQPPPARPWFQIASMARPAPAPAPAPQAQVQPSAPQPRPPFARPTFPQAFRLPNIAAATTAPPPPSSTAMVPAPRAATTTTTTTTSVSAFPIIRTSASLPTSPKTSPLASSSSVPPSPKPQISSLPTSPVLPKAPTSTSSSSVLPPKLKVSSPSLTSSPAVPPPPPPAVPTTVSSTTTTRAAAATNTISPKIKPAAVSAPPPSPLTLPHAAQIMKYSDTERQPKVTSNGKEGQYYYNKKFSDSEEFGMRGLITIAGENKGAIMELRPEANSNKKYGIGGNPAPHSTLQKKEYSPTSSSEDGRSKKQAASFMNSNVQGVNNSILCNFSCTQNDPGVHFSLSRKPNGGGGGGGGGH